MFKGITTAIVFLCLYIVYLEIRHVSHLFCQQLQSYVLVFPSVSWFFFFFKTKLSRFRLLQSEPAETTRRSRRKPWAPKFVGKTYCLRKREEMTLILLEEEEAWTSPTAARSLGRPWLQCSVLWKYLLRISVHVIWSLTANTHGGTVALSVKLLAIDIFVLQILL